MQASAMWSVRVVLQTLGVIHLLILIPFQFTIFFLFLSRYSWYALPIYLAWIAYSWRPKAGKYHNRRIQHFDLYKHAAEYFPVKLVKTVDLDPNRNYIFGYHPHGLCFFGCLLNFATNATNFDTIFPGLRSCMVTLNRNYFFPILREILLVLGFIKADKNDILHMLRSQVNKGQVVVIVVGGVAEVLEAHPFKYKLKLKHRKGFVRVALETGSDLVPVFSFGENEVFKQVANPVGSKLRTIQETIKKYTFYSVPLMYGRYGLLPFRHAINTVVGAPIVVEKKEKFSEEDLNVLHEAYITALTNLFEDHKTKYGVADDTHLSFY